jgi:hypothetical protein
MDKVPLTLRSALIAPHGTDEDVLLEIRRAVAS